VKLMKAVGEASGVSGLLKPAAHPTGPAKHKSELQSAIWLNTNLCTACSEIWCLESVASRT
jgi:Ni,Fe-hydrogenase I small subunit